MKQPLWRHSVLIRVALGMVAASTLGIKQPPVGAWQEDAVDAIVMTAEGPLQGTVAEDYRLFQGIPYAAPPVRDLRWQSPQPVAPWSAPLDATAPGNWCPQPAGMPGSLGGGEEDCLFLNVTAPHAASATAPKPVMVWIHGGGFVSGAGNITGARRLAVDGDVVVVTINYRLGILGYFGYPGLAGSGAFGLEDQQAALRWVQRNIAAFGGDPENVTLFGESAGGMSVCAQLTSPSAEGLFQKAIVQSGSCLIDWPDNGISPGAEAAGLWASPDEAAGVGQTVAQDLGCTDAPTAIACLRDLPASDLVELPLALAFGRVAYGSPTLPKDPARAMRDGGHLSMPVMMGTTRDEARTFVSFDPDPITAERYDALLDDAFGDLAGDVAERYPLAAYSSPAVAWAAAMTDRVWACPTLENERLLAATVPVFAFEFADREAPAIFPFAADLPGGAYHGSELLSLFTIDLPGVEVTLSPDQEALSGNMIRYWSNFAHSGDPNGDGLPEWRAFTPGDPSAQSLAPGPEGIGPVDYSAEHQCDFWRALGKK